MEVHEVHIGFVGDDDLAFVQAGTELSLLRRDSAVWLRFRVAAIAAWRSRARLLSCSPAVSTMAKVGRKLLSPRRRCIFAAALRRWCFAQFMQLATNSITLESTAWMRTLKRCSKERPALPPGH